MNATSTKLSYEDKQKIENCLILGKLAEDSDQLRLGEDFGKAVSVAKSEGSDAVVFYLEALSEEPELMETALGKSPREVYVSFDDKNQYFLERIGYYKQVDKVGFLREFLKNKRILFKPAIRYESRKDMYHYNFIIQLVEDMEDERERNTKFTPLPILTNAVSSEEFQSKLLNKRPIDLKSYNHAHEIPEFIMCGKHIYQIQKDQALRKYETSSVSYICDDPEEIKRIGTPAHLEDQLVIHHNDIRFITSEMRFELRDEFNTNGIPITKLQPNEEENSSQYQESKGPETEGPQSVKEDGESEVDFLNELHQLARNKQLRYKKEDLENFHISLKTSNFSILGGMSGTGKTELAMLYAEALGLVDGESLLFIPVKPSFTEPGDLLGFLNPQTGVYTESEIGLVSFLDEASKFPNKMHMVVFDEMNLGQVEHYFSDFISLLELNGDQRRLQLIGKGSHCVQAHLKNGIPVLNNVLFVGTANFDETTRDFSNRMLDRSNVIMLEKESFVTAKDYEVQNENKDQDGKNKGVQVKEAPIPSKLYNSWVKGERRLASLEHHELVVLDEIHKAISSFDSQTGVSYRIAKQIGQYLENIPTQEGVPVMERNVAFDYQIKQRILPKIRGHEEQIGELVGEYGADDHSGQLAEILNGNEEGVYPKSLEYLEQKAKELMRNGYTL
ncbi:AAA family ATPase (plasmid) [Pontibacillus sp. ALD_SL1]|uniref:McrB family protein n=1 Tax=Pontibacillus sp. ALD_SL1 TaxID=2777185 RepID=UPI001A979234|nr:AAA family ATPase [Pontibacillus sp. ALD_SL1]QST02095.1 AAA family ATPase [Pontibacillus sp. ALD_SL1]